MMREKKAESFKKASRFILACRRDKPCRWKTAQERLKQFEGVLGPTCVEPEVQDLITAFQALGIPTFASCGGHDEKYKNHPYVAIGWPNYSGNGQKEDSELYQVQLCKFLDHVHLGNLLEFETKGDHRSTIRPQDWVPVNHEYIRASQQQMIDLGKQAKAYFFKTDICTCANCPASGQKAPASSPWAMLNRLV